MLDIDWSLGYVVRTSKKARQTLRRRIRVGFSFSAWAARRLLKNDIALQAAQVGNFPISTFVPLLGVVQNRHEKASGLGKPIPRQYATIKAPTRARLAVAATDTLGNTVTNVFVVPR